LIGGGCVFVGLCLFLGLERLGDKWVCVWIGWMGWKLRLSDWDMRSWVDR
jgi:hypothetical protein